ncbi:MAG: hypothetical protein AB1405_08995 [Bdellovibrionota bacterium]
MKIFLLLLLIGGGIFAVALVRAWNELFPSSVPLVVTKAPARPPAPPEEPPPAFDPVSESVPEAPSLSAAVPAKPPELVSQPSFQDAGLPAEEEKKSERKKRDPSERRLGRRGFGRFGRDRGAPWPQGSPEETRYRELWSAYEQEMAGLKAQGEKVSRGEREALRQKVIEQVRQEFGETAGEEPESGANVSKTPDE